MSGLRRIWLFLFSLQTTYTSPLERQRARGVLYINWFIFIASIAWFGALLYLVETPDFTNTLIPLLAIVGSMIVFFSLKSEFLTVASYTLVIETIILAGFVIIGTTNPGREMQVITPLILAGILLGQAGIILTGVSMALALIVSVLGDINTGVISLGEGVSTAVGLALTVGVTTAIQSVFVGRQESIAREAIEKLDGIKRVLQSTRAISYDMKEAEVLSRMIRVLRDSYGLDSVQVYLIDENDRLSQVVRAGMRQAEIIELADDEALSLGEPHPLTDAARLRQAVMVTQQDIPRRREYLLPNLQQGLVIPLVDGGQVLGVLDIQLSQIEPLTRDEVDIFTLVAGSYSTLIHILENQDVLEQSLQEQEAIANRVQSQLGTIQAQRQQMVSNIWSEYIEQRGARSMGFDFNDHQIIRAEDMPDAMRTTLESGEVYVTIEGEDRLMSVPIMLRNEIIGAMTFAVPVARHITERQIELARTIAIRLGSALESTRLLEQTQQQANRERKASDVASLLFSATDLDSLLKLAADSFNDTLGAVQTRIFIEPGTLSSERETPAANGHNGYSQNGDRA